MFGLNSEPATPESLDEPIHESFETISEAELSTENSRSGSPMHNSSTRTIDSSCYEDIASFHNDYPAHQLPRISPTSASGLFNMPRVDFLGLAGLSSIPRSASFPMLLPDSIESACIYSPSSRFLRRFCSAIGRLTSRHQSVPSHVSGLDTVLVTDIQDDSKEPSASKPTDEGASSVSTLLTDSSVAKATKGPKGPKGPKVAQVANKSPPNGLGLTVTELHLFGASKEDAQVIFSTILAKSFDTEDTLRCLWVPIDKASPLIFQSNGSFQPAELGAEGEVKVVNLFFYEQMTAPAHKLFSDRFSDGSDDSTTPAIPISRDFLDINAQQCSDIRTSKDAPMADIILNDGSRRLAPIPLYMLEAVELSDIVNVRSPAQPLRNINYKDGTALPSLSISQLTVLLLFSVLLFLHSDKIISGISNATSIASFSAPSTQVVPSQQQQQPALTLNFYVTSDGVITSDFIREVTSVGTLVVTDDDNVASGSWSSLFADKSILDWDLQSQKDKLSGLAQEAYTQILAGFAFAQELMYQSVYSTQNFIRDMLDYLQPHAKVLRAQVAGAINTGSIEGTRIAKEKWREASVKASEGYVLAKEGWQEAAERAGEGYIVAKQQAEQGLDWSSKKAKELWESAQEAYVEYSPTIKAKLDDGAVAAKAATEKVWEYSLDKQRELRKLVIGS